ncbi:unnamed protein product [Oncorhynchus mykiss]|uniref:Uncharacterized protein n=1 Tax=Oncorhynchus mykiss TaxID=8022 RepID=A0A060WQM8_ONCMY|nr:unnamed protein product [Oncorhynchus mykiss]
MLPLPHSEIPAWHTSIQGWYLWCKRWGGGGQSYCEDLTSYKPRPGTAALLSSTVLIPTGSRDLDWTMATKEVNRAQVVRTMKVRTSLKGDGSWIRRVTDPDEEEGKPRKPELPKKPTGLFSAESSPVTSLASCNPYSPTVTPDVDPLTPEEITKWSLTSSRVRPLAKSYVLSAAKKFEWVFVF